MTTLVLGLGYPNIPRKHFSDVENVLQIANTNYTLTQNSVQHKQQSDGSSV